MKNITIWDLNKSRKDLKFNNNVLIWKNIDIENSEEISLYKYLKNNSDRIKNIYLKSVSNFGNIIINNNKLNNSFKLNNDYSLWWSSLINEKCNYQKSKEIDNLILYLAFVDWAKKNDLKEIELYSDNSNLIHTIKNWCKLNNIKFEVKSKLNFKFSFNIIYFLKLFILPLVWNIYFYINCIPYKFFKKNYLVNGKQITFVSYLLNYEIHDSKFSSKYWTHLIDKLKEKNFVINFIHIGMKESVFKSFKKIKELDNINKASNNENHTFINQNYDFITFIKVYVIYFIKVFESLRIIINLKKYNKDFNLEWNFISNDFYQSFFGLYLIKNITNFYLYKKHLCSYSKNSKCIYLFENQNWEYSLLYNWKKYVNQEIIGFSHSTVRYWDLRYFFYKDFVIKNKIKFLFPKFIAVNGDYAMNMLRKSFPSEMLSKVESLRYLHLNDNRLHKNKLRQNLKILILTDFDKNITIKQLQLVNNLENNFNKIKIFIKTHPGNNVNVGKYISLDHYVTHKNVESLFDDVDIVYTSSFSSVAVEAYFRFKKIICYLDPSSLNLSPLLDVENVDFVRNYRELSNSIENYLKMNVKNNKIENYFYLDKKLNKWMKILL